LAKTDKKKNVTVENFSAVFFVKGLLFTDISNLFFSISFDF